MGKSDEKTLVKKPDIIMEQLEDRIVFAADVANPAPVAAVTAQVQAQAQGDPAAGAAGGGTHAPDAPHQDATAAQESMALPLTRTISPLPAIPRR